MNRSSNWATVAVAALWIGPIAAIVAPQFAAYVLTVMLVVLVGCMAVADERVSDLVILSIVLIPLVGALFQMSAFTAGALGWVFGISCGFQLSALTRSLIRSQTH
jgi:hypothetical protein